MKIDIKKAVNRSCSHVNRDAFFKGKMCIRDRVNSVIYGYVNAIVAECTASVLVRVIVECIEINDKKSYDCPRNTSDFNPLWTRVIIT